MEELDKLYESIEKQDEVSEQDAVEEAVEDTTTELTESVDDEEIEIVEDDEVEDEATTEEPAEDTEAQLVLECTNCGGLIVKLDTDVKVDEESDLANIDEVCQYCEASDGYKLLGTLMPYEAEADETNADTEAVASEDVAVDTEEDDLEEGIFDSKAKQAKLRNAVRAVEAKAHTITNGESMSSLGFKIGNCYMHTCQDLGRLLKNDSKKYQVKPETVVKLSQAALRHIPEVIKALKKPNNFISPAYSIRSALDKVSAHAKETESYKELLEYINMLKQIEKLEAVKTQRDVSEKDLRKELLRIITDSASRALNSTYNSYKSKPLKLIGEGLEGPEQNTADLVDVKEDELTELLDFNVPVNVDLTANGNDVAIGGLA